MRGQLAAVLLAAAFLAGCSKEKTPTSPGGSGTIPTSSRPLIIDHNCTDLDRIPAQWIDSVQAKWRLHYAHTSHGGQLTSGLDTVSGEDSAYGYAIGTGSLPATARAFCILDGQISVTYITPDLYWQTASGMNLTRNVLNSNPSVNCSMWSWCTQLDGYDSAQVQQYLDSISSLEGEFPWVTFIYMTGNAQDSSSGGWNRHQRNEQIRAYCTANDKVLYDFGDLDCWYIGQQNLVTWNGHTFQAEHPQFNGDQVAHTTWSSCQQKGRAFWWMMARLAGWSGP
jgi:hypothetical protein